ncbi:tape measure protein [Comamonas sp. JUb58]|uniref:tape measure protein n=1 Tax=Comamonas sp. JUb58 TaxID=2485114 RepID=UPI001414FD6F|nr:tape measure protein [Comamonas sp. JUb58]
MTDVAAVGIAVETSQVQQGINKLTELAQQGPKVEQSMAGISAESKKVAKSLADLGSGAGDGLKKTGDAAQKAATGIKASGTAAREAVTSTASLARAMASLTVEEEKHIRKLVDEANGLRMTRGEMEAYRAAQRGMSTGAQEIARAMGSRIDALKVEQKELAQASREADKYAKDMLRASASSSAAEKSFRALNTAANAVSAALSIIGVGFGAREIITQIDGYTKFTAQLKLATKGASDYSAAMASVQRISTDAQQGIGELGTLYARIANGTASLNLSQQKLSDITETVALSLKVSGATASEASSAMLQLSQAFASGVLRGEEFNSVNEAAPRLMKALADGLGVPVGALRKMAEAGQLTSAVLADSLPKALGKLREEAESVQTISGAFTVLKNNIMLMVGAQATASGATKGFANGISMLANNLDVLATVGGAVALVLGARFTASIASTGVAFAASTIQAARYQLTLASMAGVSTTAATGLIAMGGAARGASAAMAFLGGPLGLILTVAGAATAAFYTFRDSSESLVKSIGGLNQPLDQLKKKLDALPAEKQIVIKMAIQDEQQRAVKQAQKLTDDLIQSIAGAANIRMPADQFDLMIEALREASKEGGNLAPVLQNAVSAGYLPRGRIQEWLNMAAALREVQAAARGAAEAQSTTVPLVSAENNVFLQRARAALDAAKSYKSQAERMREVQDAGKKLAGELKNLQNAQLGNSKEAKDLEERIKGVNEQLASMAKKGRDTSGAAAVKKEVNEYNTLVASIQGKIDLNREELRYSGNLNDAQKAEIKLNADLTAGKVKLNAAHEADLRARLAIWKAQEQAKEQTRRDIEAYKEQVAVQDEAAKAYVRLYDGMTKARLAIDGLQSSTTNDTDSLRVEASLIGASNAQRRMTVQLYDLQLERKKELLKLDETDFATAKDRAEAEQRINDIYDKRAENTKTSAYVEEWSATVQQVEDIFVNGFADMMNNGKSGWESFCKSLRTSFFTLVAKQIYKMLAEPFVVNIVGNLLGVAGGAGGLLGGLLGGSSGGGGLGGLMNLGSAANTGYGLYTGLTFTTAGNWMMSAGDYMGWNWLSNAGATVGGWGASSASGAAAYGGSYAAPSGVGMVNVPSSGGMGAYAGVGYAAAIVMAAAYLGGMFKEEKQVGSGITGELGGDLYGYQLMRESGGLFDGPDYRYVVAEQEQEKSRAEIERLKKEIADNPNDARNAYRERQIQQQYSRLEMLEQYNGSIEALSSPIKALQDAFLTMREDTAARADTLGLDGDSIRAMRVTLGLDDIHPDTGGKGLELTGLSQEEAAAKIQAALAQANEEMARSVLGTWQEQTREVTRMVWDNVELPSDGDTQQYGRVGREMTETVTEQVFVMSEYVRAGETAVQALTRLSDSLLSVNTVFDMLGVTLMDTSLAGADLASDIIDAFGGGEQFSAATGNYYGKFYSDQEKAQNQARLLNEQLKKLGVDTMPASREAFKEYINGIDLSTEEGRKLYASLLVLVDVFDMIYTSAENIASLKEDLNLQLLRAQGNDAEALRLEREKQIKELEKYNDPELVRMQRDVWAAEDKTKADEEAKQAAETAKALGMKNLEAAVSREKEYWNQFTADAKDALSKASSYFDLVTNAAKSLRESVEDGSSWAAAAGMVFIEQALTNARNGGGLSDLEATKSAIEAATGGLVMDNYATQAELDYDKKVLAGQLDELGGYAELAKSDAQKQIDLATSQIKRLDDTLTFWKEYGETQVNATLSVTDAIKALEKLMFPEKDAAEGGGSGASSGRGGGSFGGGGGYIIGSNSSESMFEGYLPDGRPVYKDGSIGTAMGNTADQLANGKDPYSNYPDYSGSGKVVYDEEKGLYVPKLNVGTNYLPSDMLAMVHKGERVIPAADNRALMDALQNQGAGSGNAELIAEVKALRTELQEIKANTASTAQSTGSTSRTLNDATDNGNAMKVSVMSN